MGSYLAGLGCVVLAAFAHLTRDGTPSLGENRTFLARLLGTGILAFAGYLAGEWLGAAFGLAVGVGFWTDQKHGEGQNARDLTDGLWLLCSGVTSLLPLAVAFLLAGHWRTALLTTAVAALKPPVWFLAWRFPVKLYPTRIAATVFGALVGLLLLASPAVGHSWYDYACCSERDCAALDPKNVREVRTGYIVTHKGKEYFFPEETVRQSQDEDFHACEFTHNEELRPGCLYAPPRGV
jgi:YHS domain-containing protein